MNFLIKSITYYDHEELKAEALSRPTAENLEALATWYGNFGDQFWNGEEWKIDETHNLRPVYDETAEEPTIIKYKIV